MYLRRGMAYGCGRSLSGLMNGPCRGMHLTYRDYGQFLSLAGCDELRPAAFAQTLASRSALVRRRP